MLKRILGVAAVGVLAGFLSVSTARADNTQFVCGGCTSGGTSLISSGTSVSFSFVDVANQTVSGDGFVGILVPTGGAAPTFTGGTFEESKSFGSGDTIASVLGESTNNFNFSQLSSASAQVGPTPTGFTVYEYDLGSVTLGPSGAGVSLSADAAAGSVIIGWLETDDGTLETPLSESITTGGPSGPPPSVPEPASSSLLLLGIGLLAVPLGLRKRLGSIA